MLQIAEGKVALTNTKLKGKYHSCGKNGHKQTKCPEKKIKQRKQKETRNFLAHATTMERQATSLQIAGNMRPTKTKDPRIGRRKVTWKLELQTLRSC